MTPAALDSSIPPIHLHVVLFELVVLDESLFDVLHLISPRLGAAALGGL